MDFRLNYTSEAKKLDVGEDKKVILSNDAFAISEMIDALIEKIEHLRLAK